MAALPSSPLLAALVSGLFAGSLVMGCGGKDEDEPLPVAEPEVPPTPTALPLPPAPDPVGESCSPLGRVQECTVTLEKVGDVNSCFVGLQVCEKEADDEYGWTACMTSEDATAALEAMVNGGELTDEELETVLTASGGT